MENDFRLWANNIQKKVEVALEQALPASSSELHQLHQAMRYSVLAGGKRVRPLLAFASAELFTFSLSDSLAIAVSLELIHAYSLIHDDLPCMDDDVLRRGRPTCHIQFDEATALLAGDALLTLAFEHLARHKFANPQVNLQLIIELSRASGANGMVEGQAIDLAAVGKTIALADLQLMHSKKTGALIRAAVLMGALANSSTINEQQFQALQNFGENCGILFQVVDDILDYTSSSIELGKTAGKDAANNKPTYVSLLGLAVAQQFAEQLRNNCQESLQLFAADKALRLGQLVDYINNRSN